MRHRLNSLLLAATLVVATATGDTASAQTCTSYDVDSGAGGHPRLLVNDTTLPTIVAWTGVANPTTDEEMVASELKASVLKAAESYETHLWNDPWWDDSGAQARAGDALICVAMGYLIETDSVKKAQYLSRATSWLTNWSANGFPIWHAGQFDRHLGKADLLIGLSLAFDWLYPQLSEELRCDVLGEMHALILETRADMSAGGWSDFAFVHGTEWNHQSIVCGGMGMALLALDPDDPGSPGFSGHVLDSGDAATLRSYLADCRTVLSNGNPVGYLNGAGFGDEGGYFEGVGYGGYGLHTVLPFALALERLSGDEDQLDVSIHESGVASAVDWLIYEQLPYNPKKNTILNDSGDDSAFYSKAGGPVGQNQSRLSGYSMLPWLMPPSGQNAGLYHMMTTSLDSLHNWEYYVQYPATPFGHSKSSAFGILSLYDHWPSPSQQAYPPTDYRNGKWFAGRGLIHERSGFHFIDAEGRAQKHDDGQGYLFSFECRNAPVNEPTFHGHAQYDTNHFLFYALGKPVFYEVGTGKNNSYAWNSTSHNVIIPRGVDARKIDAVDPFGNPVDTCVPDLCEPSYLWDDYETRYGSVLRYLQSEGDAPSLVSGDNTTAWTWRTGVNGEFDYANRAQRHIWVVPRAGQVTPYLLTYDDFEAGDGALDNHKGLAGSEFQCAPQTGIQFDWIWRCGPGGSFSNDGQTATMTDGAVTATTTVLSPDLVPVSHFPGAKINRFRTDCRYNSDFISLVETSTGPATLSATALDIPEQDRFAYLIDDGGVGQDFVAIRRPGDCGRWDAVFMEDTVEHIVTTDAQMVFLRFSGAGVEFEDVYAASMVDGTYLAYDNQHVIHVAQTGTSDPGVDVTADENELILVGEGIDSYIVGPFVPDVAFENGVEGSVVMREGPEFVKVDALDQHTRLHWSEPRDRTDVDYYEVWWRNAAVGGNLELLATSLDSPSLEHDHGIPNSPQLDLEYQVKVVYDNDDTDETPVAQAVPICAHLLAPCGEESPAVLLNDWVKFQSYFLQNQEHADMTGEDGVPDGSVELEDFVTFQAYFLWGQSSGLTGGGGPGAQGPETQNPELVGDLENLLVEASSASLALRAPAPNPFEGSTSISFELPTESAALLEIFDAGGRRVRTLIDRDLSVGSHVVEWNGRTDEGAPVAPGVYFARLAAAGDERTERVVLLK